MKIEVADVNSDVVFFLCHLPFVRALVLLPFRCEALGLTLTADLEASLPSSEFLSLLLPVSALPAVPIPRDPALPLPSHSVTSSLFLCPAFTALP